MTRRERWVRRTRESVARALAGDDVPESASSLEDNLDINDYATGIGFIDRRSAREISAALVWLEKQGYVESMTFDRDDYDYAPGKHYMLTRAGREYARLAEEEPTR